MALPLSAVAGGPVQRQHLDDDEETGHATAHVIAAPHTPLLLTEASSPFLTKRWTVPIHGLAKPVLRSASPAAASPEDATSATTSAPPREVTAQLVDHASVQGGREDPAPASAKAM